MLKMIADKNLVAYCGLYCGACRSYLAEKCPGCQKNIRATWCQIRACCIQNQFSSCADCKSVQDVNDCKKFNNFISKLFALIFRSNRKACIQQISQVGIEKYASEMAQMGQSTIKKK